jgi:hypothetical protein
MKSVLAVAVDSGATSNGRGGNYSKQKNYCNVWFFNIFVPITQQIKKIKIGKNIIEKPYFCTLK